MKKNLFYNVLILVLTLNSVQAQWIESGEIVEGQVRNGFFGERVAISSDGLTMAVSDPFRFVSNAPNPVSIFKREGLEWVEMQEILNDGSSGDSSLDFFGFSTSMSNDGTVLAVGVPRGSNPGGIAEGLVKVFRETQGNWEQVGGDIVNNISGATFGNSTKLSADGSIVAISNPDSGITQVFRNEADQWIQIGSDIGMEIVEDFFGHSISLSHDGTILAIGILEARPFSQNRTGRVEIYAFENDEWTQLGSSINGTNPGGQFGTTVALSGDGQTLAAAAISPNLNSVSYVEIYRMVNNDWVQVGNTLTNCNGCLVSEFGYGITLVEDGSLIAVSDPSGLFNDNDELDQTLDFYKLENGIWTSIQQIVIGNSILDGEERFGASIAFAKEGSMIVVGSPEYIDSNDQVTGAVRTYENSDLLSTNKTELDTSSVVYPNPILNHFTIDFKEIQKTLNVSVFDIQGRKVENLDFYNTSTVDINLEASAGTYFIKVTNTLGRVKTFKAIKK